MKIFTKTLLFAALCGVLPSARANDGIFPPLPAAKSAINFDGRGFLINGQRTFLASGTIHYPRVPRALWRDRLLRLKRGGFNCVETYAFWNYHEEKPGQFRFSGEKDFEAFLRLAQEVGLFVIVRPGPYICAEWQSGGFPEWLRFESGLRVREENPQFLNAVDRWYEQILPIIARHQIHRGGSVVMVQLENEHPRGWGTEMPTPYFTHLLQKARELRIEVPTFFSGLHHGVDPAPLAPISSKNRTNPWFSTEFWPGWFNLYGPLPPTGDVSLRRFERGTWRVLSNGGNGYNFYTLHGGSNFGTWNSNEDASSYDYAAAIGQTGDLRPIYFRFKRANLFATSFSAILADSDDASADFQNFATGASITARKSPAGTLIFLDNPGETASNVRLESGETLQLEAGEVVGLARNCALDETFKIRHSAARILGFSRQNRTTTLVIYGNVGEIGGLNVQFPTDSTTASPAWKLDAQGANLEVKFAAGAPQEHILARNGQRLRVLAMDKAMADRTFFVASKGANYVVCGASYIGDFQPKTGGVSLTAEEPLDTIGAPDVLVYGDKDAQRLAPPKIAEAIPVAPRLQGFETLRADREAAPDFNDAKWKSSPAPLPMGADGDTGAHAWYRAPFRVAVGGDTTLNFENVSDWALVYVDGKIVGSSRVQTRGKAVFPLQLAAGDHSLAILTSHLGRSKLFNIIGSLETIDQKGIAGPVTLESRSVEPGRAISNWRFRAEPRGAAANTSEAAAALETGGESWKPATGGDIFGGRPGFAWFVADLGEIPSPNRRAHFEDVDDNATIFLNGQKVGTHQGYAKAFDVPLEAAWRANGPNTLAVLVENTGGGGGINGVSQLRNGLKKPGQILQSWKMRGGLLDATKSGESWTALPAAFQPGSVAPPMFYRMTFEAPRTPNLNAVLRISLFGLGRGFVWLNGHNLGRYPEKVPVDGIYLPENWIKAGKNQLIVLDETGAAPNSLYLRVEAPASRRVMRYGAEK